MTPRYEGTLQGVGSGMALGWAADASDPLARVPVSLVVDGEIVAEGLADLPRPDLSKPHLGDGAHGFLLELPTELQRPGRRQILVLAGPEQTPLRAASSFWQEPASDGAWGEVVLVPGGALSASVAEPPGVAGQPCAVVSDGWLLPAAEEQTDSREATEEELDRMVTVLCENAHSCAELGIVYIPALIPRKRAVIAASRPRAREWVRRLNAKLRDVDEVELFDLLGVLRDGANRHGGAYHRTDADWNDRGAFYAARALLKEAHQRIPALHPPPLTELRLRSIPAYLGTLAQAKKLEPIEGELLPCESPIEPESGVAVDPSALRALRMPVEHTLAQAGSTHLRVYATPDQDEEARLAVLGDAAALPLLPWLAERAGRTTFFWTLELPVAQLALELPRVVFHLLREADAVSALSART